MAVKCTCIILFIETPSNVLEPPGQYSYIGALFDPEYWWGSMCVFYHKQASLEISSCHNKYYQYILITISP